jgi:hypothetical protein
VAALKDGALSPGIGMGGLQQRSPAFHQAGLAVVFALIARYRFLSCVLKPARS